ncbi:hypothetical protein QUF95_18290 [Paenibacillus silvae]|uniref:hypothetical protein n=1 Tax=Paenibacillus silvae TaxID=1325358 RepID=UPI0025A00C36|nr:hypothetical protein [Paenibacillus silvae]MDM5279349.1 hypothetical protein [Paenibacillus silvae]
MWGSEGSDSVCADKKYIDASERLIRSLRGPEQKVVLASGLLFRLHNRTELDMQAYYGGEWIQWRRGLRDKFACGLVNLVK